MSLPDAVDTDTHIVIAHLGYGIDIGLVDQGAVGGQAGIETHGLGPVGDGEDIRAQQGFPSGEDQHRHPETLEVVHHRKDLLGGQFPGKVDIRGDGIAVFAGEVTAAHQVPDHHRPRRLAGRAQRLGGLGQRLHILGDSEHGPPPGGFLLRLGSWWPMAGENDLI